MYSKDVSSTSSRTPSVRPGGPGLVVEGNDSMETLPSWDSLSFMTVFLAINDAFNLDPDFDDAVHYMAVPTLVSYLRGHVPS